MLSVMVLKAISINKTIRYPPIDSKIKINAHINMTRLQNKRVVLSVASHCLLLCHVPLSSLALSETATKNSHSWGGMTLPSTLPVFTSATHPQSLLQRHVLKEEEQQSPQTITTTRQPTAKQQQKQQQSPTSSRRQFKNIEELLASFREEPVLIAFTAVNCGPCKLQKRELEKAQKRLVVDKKASSSTTSTATSSSSATISGSSFPRVVAIDTNKWPHVGSRFHVGKLPCLVAILNGKVLFRLEGLTMAEDVVSRLLVNNNNNDNVAAASLSVDNVPEQQQQKQ